MKIDGACHCGNITYEAEINSQQVLVCHCTDCQILSGSAYRTVVPAIEGSFKLLSGALKTYIKIAESGVKRSQTFCPDCGSPIYAGPVDGDSGMLGIRVGTTRQRGLLRPQSQYWCDSALDWVEELSSVVKVPTQ
jgi:hypothetical protein